MFNPTKQKNIPAIETECNYSTIKNDQLQRLPIKNNNNNNNKHSYRLKGLQHKEAF